MTVLARDSVLTNCFATNRIPIGCDCATCETAGSGSSCPMPNRFRQSFNLGRLSDNRTAGDLRIEAETLSAALAPPQALVLNAPCGGVEALYDTNSALRQVKAPDALADIVVSNEYRYSIAFYKAGDITGQKDGDGFYVVPQGGGYVSWTIENADASTNTCGALRIIRSKGGSSVTNEVTRPDAQTWSVSKGNGLRVEKASSAWDAGSNALTVTTWVENAQGHTLSKTVTRQERRAWGMALVESVSDPDGAALTDRWFYYENPAEIERYGRVSMTVNADGSWRKCDYGANGLQSVEIEPFKDSGTNASASEARATYYDYTLHPGEVGGEKPYSPRTVTETALGVTVGRTFYAYTTNAAGERVDIVERCASAHAAYGDAGNLRTVTTMYLAGHTNAALAGRTRCVEYPDGRLDYSGPATFGGPILRVFGDGLCGFGVRSGTGLGSVGGV